MHDLNKLAYYVFHYTYSCSGKRCDKLVFMFYRFLDIAFNFLCFSGSLVLNMPT